MVSPADFIPLSEDTGLIIPIGEWVLNTACGILKHWQNDPLFTSLKLAVNLSARQFQDSNLVAKISHSIQNSEINPARLELEITESAAMHKEEKTIETLKIIKELGGGLAMDDFGTGYSSLSYLKKFPIDKLKIDQAFVRELSTDTDDAAIVRTIIDMARALGLRVIAEGAETREQVDYLQEHGCDEIQGYFFAKPMPIAEFEDFVRNFNFSAYFPRKSKKMQN
jgi:EAL domain-containing protein (putative c-di-GMP-specific phosphodiesterase class I)